MIQKSENHLFFVSQAELTEEPEDRVSLVSSFVLNILIRKFPDKGEF
jgi:hypothetical protein